MSDHDDFFYDDERQCCKDACIVVYHYGMAIAHCYSGTRNTWEDAARNGYFDKCNSAYMIIGENLE